MIDLTNVDMVKFVQKVYDLSQPQGMGMMHFVAGPLSEEDAKRYIDTDGHVSMDYVSGRACKMHTRIQDGRMVMNDRWYDHSDEQLAELLAHLGITATDGTAASEHSPSCNCDVCRNKRGLENLDPQKDYEKSIKAHEDGTAFKITTHKDGQEVEL
jgi:hypothetical protein